MKKAGEEAEVEAEEGAEAEERPGVKKNKR